MGNAVGIIAFGALWLITTADTQNQPLTNVAETARQIAEDVNFVPGKWEGSSTLTRLELHFDPSATEAEKREARQTRDYIFERAKIPKKQYLCFSRTGAAGSLPMSLENLGLPNCDWEKYSYKDGKLSARAVCTLRQGRPPQELNLEVTYSPELITGTNSGVTEIAGQKASLTFEMQGRRVGPCDS